MNIIRIVGETRDKKGEILWYDSTHFVCYNQEVWDNILNKFDYYNKRADSLGYYAQNDWMSFIQQRKVSKSGEIIYDGTILKMTKELYHKYHNIKYFPYKPVFNKNISAYDIGVYNQNTDKYDLYYGLDGFVSPFKNEWDAWKYIYNNIEIK